jgi:hypothetical protein
VRLRSVQKRRVVAQMHADTRGDFDTSAPGLSRPSSRRRSHLACH